MTSEHRDGEGGVVSIDRAHVVMCVGITVFCASCWLALVMFLWSFA